MSILTCLVLTGRSLALARYMVDFVNKHIDAEVLLDCVGMVHWLRQEDQITEYDDFLNQDELSGSG